MVSTGVGDQIVPSPAPLDPSAAAFFDVDNTIMRGASAFYFARGLYRRKFFTVRDLVGFTWQQLRFIAVGENLAQLDRMRERALTFVHGHDVAELRAIGEEVYDEGMAAKIWPGTLALAQVHLDAGEQVWLATATPVEMADVDGVYTGRLCGQPLHGVAKADAVRALAEREGLDLSRCSAYSDSANDIPLLELVGHPCAVNPDAALRAHALARGWRLRDFRRGRKAARLSLPALSGVGAGALGVLASSALQRRRHSR